MTDAVEWSGGDGGRVEDGQGVGFVRVEIHEEVAAAGEVVVSDGAVEDVLEAEVWHWWSRRRDSRGFGCCGGDLHHHVMRAGRCNVWGWGATRRSQLTRVRTWLVTVLVTVSV